MSLPAPPELRDGADLLLRRHRTDDVDAIVAQCQDPDVQRFTTVPVPYDRPDAEQFLALTGDGWADGSLAAFAIEVDGRFAGSVDLRLVEGGWAGIGFALSPWARGRGVMTRAVHRVLGWGFGELGLVGVQWQALVGNTASLRVAEGCGFRLEGTVRGLVAVRGDRHDGWIGTLLAAEHRPPRG